MIKTNQINQKERNMKTRKQTTKRTRTADFNKIKEYGIYCSRNMGTAIIELTNEKKVFISVDNKRREPCLRFYTAEEALQW